MSMQAFRSNLSDHPELPVKFYLDNTRINAEYHLTEIRAATVKSLDCGRNSAMEQWNEITIQLLDGPANSAGRYMSAKKFSSILEKALTALSIDDDSALFFEFAPDNGPIRKLSIASIARPGNEMSIFLDSEKAICKPLARTTKGHLAPGDASQGCCSDSTGANSNRCCG